MTPAPFRFTALGNWAGWALQRGGRVLPCLCAESGRCNHPWPQVTVASYDPRTCTTTIVLRLLTEREMADVRTDGPGSYYLP
jgi:hypothetical protein